MPLENKPCCVQPAVMAQAPCWCSSRRWGCSWQGMQGQEPAIRLQCSGSPQGMGIIQEVDDPMTEGALAVLRPDGLLSVAIAAGVADTSGVAVSLAHAASCERFEDGAWGQAVCAATQVQGTRGDLA